MPETISFVGVGRMGGNMVRRLKDRGRTISAVFDTNSPAAASLAAELGVRHATTLADVAASADIVVTVVSDDAAQRSLFGAPGVGDSLLANARGKVFVNCATLTPDVHVEVARRAAAAGADTLEACMASSIPQAR